MNSPVAPKTECLPFAAPGFSWENFEQFVSDFLMSRPNVEGSFIKSARLYGRRGGRQHGIDVIAETDDGKVWVFSCKHYDRATWTAKKTEKAIEKLSLSADRKFLVVATADGTVVEPAFKLAEEHGWKLWDGRGLTAAFHAGQIHDLEKKRLLFTYFGREWARHFGFEGRSALRTSSVHFLRFRDPNQRFHLLHPLIGRAKELERLVKFVVDGPDRVMTVVGAPGTGKSRLLAELEDALSRSAHANSVILRFVDPSATTQEILDDIERTKSTIGSFGASAQANPKRPSFVIVLDDGHRLRDLRRAILDAAAERPDIKVLLALRPNAEADVDRDLRNAAIDPVSRLTISKASDADIEQLVRSILGETTPARRINALVERSQGRPLIATFLAERSKKTSRSLKEIEHDPEFVDGVFKKMLDDAIVPIYDKVSKDHVDAVLRTIASLEACDAGEPFNELVARYSDPAAKPLKIAEIVDALAQSQIIDDDGRKIRIVPDVLSDDIVARAAFDRQGRSTGFVKDFTGFLVKDAGTKRQFVDLYLDRLLSTFGYAEWRRPSELKRGKSIAEPLARWTIDALDDPAISSSELLAPWSKAAALLPEATIDIADALLANHPKDVSTEFLSPIRHVPSLLESVATGRKDFAAPALDRLLDLASKSKGSLSHNDGHPIESFRRVFELTRWKDVDVLMAGLDWLLGRVEKLPRDAAAAEDTYGKVLRMAISAVLESSTHDIQWTKSLEVTIGSGPLDLDRTAPLRQRATEILRTWAKRGSTRALVDIIAICRSAVGEPRLRVGGAAMTDDYRRRWHHEQRPLVELVVEIFSTSEDAVVRLMARRFFLEIKRRDTSAYVERVKEIEEANRPSWEDELVESLSSLDFHLKETSFDLSSAQARWKAKADGVVEEIVRRQPYPAKAFAVIDRHHESMRSVDLRPNPSILAAAMVSQSTTYAVELARICVAQPTPTALAMFPTLAIGIIDRHPEDALALTGELLNHRQEALLVCGIETCLGLKFRGRTLPELLVQKLMQIAVSAEGKTADALIRFALLRPEGSKLIRSDRDIVLSIPTTRDNAGPLSEAAQWVAHLSDVVIGENAGSFAVAILQKAVKSTTTGVNARDDLAYVVQKLVDRFPCETIPFLLGVAANPDLDVASFDDYELLGLGARIKDIVDRPDIAHAVEALEDAVLASENRPSIAAVHLVREIWLALPDRTGSTIRRKITSAKDMRDLRRLWDFLSGFDHNAILLDYPEEVRELLARVQAIDRDAVEELRDPKSLPALGSTSAVAGVPEAEWAERIRKTRALASKYALDAIVGNLFRGLADHEEQALQKMRAAFGDSKPST